MFQAFQWFKRAGVQKFGGYDDFDFFSAAYFFIARRFFCLARLCKFFRASCFMIVLLVRRDNGGLCADQNPAP